MDSIFQSHFGLGHASAKLGTAGPNETLTQFLQAERPERKVVTAKIHPEKINNTTHELQIKYI